MTVYDARKGHRGRAGTRLRLIILNSVPLLAVWAVVMVLVWFVPPAPCDGGLVLTAGLGLVATCVIAVVGGYLVAGRVLRPLHEVTTMARRLSGETLDQRIRYSGGDAEVAEFAQTINALLDRITAAFESQKRFVANASHELRTPLAVMRTEIDVTTGDPEADVGEYRRMATVVRDASIRANDLVESLLILARSEAQAGRRLVRKAPVDLRSGVAAALSSIGPEARRLTLDVRTQLAQAEVIGDPELLGRLAGNLIENAVRYNHLAGSMVVQTGEDGTSAWLVVRNTGFEVDPDDLPALFEPFRRGGRERTGCRGTGLGLSIVRAVCDAHGGTVSAVALPGGGLEVTARFPAAAMTPVLAGSAAVEPALARCTGQRRGEPLRGQLDLPAAGAEAGEKPLDGLR